MLCFNVHLFTGPFSKMANISGKESTLFVSRSIIISPSLTMSLNICVSLFRLLQLYGTLFQPAFILFFVYWVWNRFDISLDAIVKYFASGFFICTGISIIYEMIASILASIILNLISILGVVGMVATGTINIDDLIPADDDIVNTTNYDSIEAPIAFSIAIALLTAFLNAFVVAALVEELGKYLSFWMVEHPDLENDKVLLSSATSSLFDNNNGNDATDEGLSSDDGETTKLHLHGQALHPLAVNQTVLAPVPSLVSIGAATTIAMITVRAFCCISIRLFAGLIYLCACSNLSNFCTYLCRRRWDLHVLRIYCMCLFTHHQD